MNYQFSDFYKRDVSFVFDDENDIDFSTLNEGKKIQFASPFLYTVDKIDSYINSYDLLPTIGLPLVSEKFRDTFLDLTKSQIEFIPVIIRDDKQNKNTNFLALNILNVISCMEEEKSITEKTRYGTLKIKKLHFIKGALKNMDIVRMEEHKSYIIVTEVFKNKCEKANLKGINFIEEGHSIYTDV